MNCRPLENPRPNATIISPANWQRPLLYLITNRLAFRHNPAEQLLLVERAAQAGCQLIQIREKDLPARALREFTQAAIVRAYPHAARVLVNDRLDVALAAGADGVHLRVSSLTVADARSVVQAAGRTDFLLGVSTHSVTEAMQAEAMGADFLVSGPIFDTPSKRAYGPPLGIEKLAEVCTAVRIPTLALGGITRDNFRAPLQSGASGIAAISLFQQPETIETIITEINAFAATLQPPKTAR